MEALAAARSTSRLPSDTARNTPYALGTGGPRPAPRRLPRIAGRTRRGDLIGAHAPLPAELRALRDELDVHERGSARGHVRALRRHASPSTTTRRCSRSRAARRSCAPRCCRTSPSARPSSAARPAALSGMFWAKDRRIPPPIKRAIDALDHFSVQPRRLPRARGRPRRRLPRARHAALRGQGRQLAPRRAWTPTTRTSSSAPRRSASASTTACRCSSTASTPSGRARGVARRETRRSEPSTIPSPCTLAAWPLVAFDGTVVACGNDDVVDGPAPAHLRLGHANVDGWPAIRAALSDLAMLRAIRTFGPEYLVAATAAGRSPATATARRAASSPTTPASSSRGSRRYMDTPSGALIEEQVVAMQRHAGPPVLPAPLRAGPLRRPRDARRAGRGGVVTRLGWQEIEDIRNERGRSTLLFITDRCPVGCAHCSVDSRRDSPTITDFELFGEIVEWLARSRTTTSSASPAASRSSSAAGCRSPRGGSPRRASGSSSTRAASGRSGPTRRRGSPTCSIAATTVFLSHRRLPPGGRRRRPLRQRRAGDPARRGVDRRAGARRRRHGAARRRPAARRVRAELGGLRRAAPAHAAHGGPRRRRLHAHEAPARQRVRAVHARSRRRRSATTASSRRAATSG